MHVWRCAYILLAFLCVFQSVTLAEAARISTRSVAFQSLSDEVRASSGSSERERNAGRQAPPAQLNHLSKSAPVSKSTQPEGIAKSQVSSAQLNHSSNSAPANDSQSGLKQSLLQAASSFERIEQSLLQSIIDRSKLGTPSIICFCILCSVCIFGAFLFAGKPSQTRAGVSFAEEEDIVQPTDTEGEVDEVGDTDLDPVDAASGVQPCSGDSTSSSILPAAKSGDMQESNHYSRRAKTQLHPVHKKSQAKTILSTGEDSSDDSMPAMQSMQTMPASLKLYAWDPIFSDGSADSDLDTNDTLEDSATGKPRAVEGRKKTLLGSRHTIGGLPSGKYF